MKVLFFSKGDLPDYQSEMVFHGGRSVIGNDFVDANKAWYHYKSDKDLYWNDRVPGNGKEYGRGFTMTGHFEEDNIDRENIKEKIEDHYFDKIIYGSSNRCQDYIDLVQRVYKKEDIIFIDGEDGPGINFELVGKGIYYKRELQISPTIEIRPINFAIPSFLIVDKISEKTQFRAHIIPGNSKTYIYDTQSDYYNGYRKSYFALTFKKGGWDCLRHYEILMNGCIPEFLELEKCPPHTMVNFPKELVIEANGDRFDKSFSILEDYSYKLLEYTKENLTTEKLFNYIINA
jgi:hypothetical protein